MAVLQTKNGDFKLSRLIIRGLGFDEIYSGTLCLEMPSDRTLTLKDTARITLDGQSPLVIHMHKITEHLKSTKHKELLVWFSGINNQCKYDQHWRSFKAQPIKNLVQCILHDTGWEIKLLTESADINYAWQQADESTLQTFIRLCQHLNLHFILHGDNLTPTISIGHDINALVKKSQQTIHTHEIINYKMTNNAVAQSIAVDLHNSLYGGANNYAAHIALSDTSEKIILRDLAHRSEATSNLHLLNYTASTEARQMQLALSCKKNLALNCQIKLLEQSWRVICKKINLSRISCDTRDKNEIYEYILQPAKYTGIRNKECKHHATKLQLATIKKTHSYAQGIYEIYFNDNNNPQLARSTNLWTEIKATENNGSAVVLPPETKVVVAFMYGDANQPIVLGCFGQSNSNASVKIKLGDKLQYSIDDEQNFICENAHIKQTNRTIQQAAPTIKYTAEQIQTNISRKYNLHSKDLQLQCREVNFYSNQKIKISCHKLKHEASQANVFCKQYTAQHTNCTLDCHNLTQQSKTLNLQTNKLYITAENISINCSQRFKLSGPSAQISICAQGISCNNVSLSAATINV